MTLIEPTIWDKVKPYKTWLIYGGLAVVLVGLALALFSWGSDYFFQRDIDKLKSNVNTALTEVNAVAANIAAEKEAAKRIAENVNAAVQEYQTATNLTDATRSNVNAAIERMKQAANSNTGNVNAAELHEVLKGL